MNIISERFYKVMLEYPSLYEEYLKAADNGDFNAVASRDSVLLNGGIHRNILRIWRNRNPVGGKYAMTVRHGFT